MGGTSSWGQGTPWRVVLTAATLLYVGALALAATGALVGAFVPCSAGLECLNQPFYGGLVGLAAALLVLWALSSRLDMGWWWIPSTVALGVLGVAVGTLTLWWVGAAVLIAAPVLSGRMSLRGRAAGAPAGEPHPRRSWRGWVIIAATAAGAAGAWWLVDLRDQRELIAQVEATGIEVYAPSGREDLAVDSVQPVRSEGPVRYTMVRRGEDASWVRIVLARPGSETCPETSSITCVPIEDGLTVARAQDRVTVYRELDGASVLVGPSPGSSRMHGWTEETLVELARDLRPVSASWIVSRGT